jgi:hypothetical protein
MNRAIQSQYVGRPLHQLLKQRITAICTIGDDQCWLLVVSDDVM